VTVAFFGDGSMNQGMLLEAMNLAAVWNLPVLFVCKDDQWAITTKSSRVTGGDLIDRAQGLGLKAVETDGREVGQVWDTAHQAIEKARTDEGPTFIRAQCVHLEGHFLGYPLLRTTRHPIREMPGMTAPLVRSFIRLEGAELHERINGLKIVTSSILNTLRDPRQDHANDPLARTRAAIESDTVRLLDIEDNVKKEIETILASALSESTP
jgi:pyruvate dehydrogenase E1 component alpha subunit